MCSLRDVYLRAQPKILIRSYSNRAREESHKIAPLNSQLVEQFRFYKARITLRIPIREITDIKRYLPEIVAT